MPEERQEVELRYMKNNVCVLTDIYSNVLSCIDAITLRERIRETCDFLK